VRTSDRYLGDPYWFVLWCAIKQTRVYVWRPHYDCRLVFGIMPFFRVIWDRNPKFSEWAMVHQGTRDYYIRLGKLIIGWALP
jgi:hypothetical protein